jgi:hypothetical protein
MSVARSIIRMSVLPLVVPLPSPRSLPSYQEESSPEVSPPHGGTPNETECLKMHSPEIHTSRVIVNYNKEEPLNVVHLRSKAWYNLVKEWGTDERFWIIFH